MLASVRNTARNRLSSKTASPTSHSVVSTHLRVQFRRKGRLANMSSSARSNNAFVAAIDQGTSSTRVILYNTLGESLVTHQVPLRLITPSPGWVEQDPLEVLDTVKVCMQQVVEKAKERGFSVSPSYIKAIGITNQRETTVVWDKTTGKPLYNTIVWSDARTHKMVAKLNERYSEQGGLDRFRTSTGLPISTYFSAIKLRWLINHVAEVKQAVEEKRALFGTIDTWLMWNLTGGVEGGVHVTDVTNASRTLLMDLNTLSWDSAIASELGIPMELLPSIKSSAEVYGTVKSSDLSDFSGVPISGCLGDQQAALVGQQCLSKGLAKSTYGTGCFVLYNTGTEIIHSKHGLLTTVGYKLGPQAKVHYALEGSISTAGSGIDWLKGCFDITDSTKHVFSEAASVPNAAGVAFVPAFNGLLAPRWRPDARGAIIGLSFATKRAHIIRALIESIAFQAADVLKAMALDANAESSSEASSSNGTNGATKAEESPLQTSRIRVKVDGGLSKADLLLQIQSDALNATVERPDDIETTARGAAFAAGVAVGLFPSDSSGHPMLEQHLTSFAPKDDAETRARNQRRWDKAVERSLDWALEGEYEDE